MGTIKALTALFSTYCTFKGCIGTGPYKTIELVLTELVWP